MSMILHLIRVHASRRKQRQEAKGEWERASLSPQAIRSRRYRRILAGILVLIGAIAFVEVVLVPGSMIRRNISPPIAKASTGPEVEEKPQLPPWLMPEEQKAERRQQNLERMEQKLRATHLQLGNACVELNNAQDSLTEYSRTRLHVVPSKSTTVAPAMVDVLANEPTAAVAWASVLQVSDRASSQLKDAREQLEFVKVRFAAGSFLDDDDRDMNSKIKQLDQTRLALEQARGYVNHIATLQRARAALAHQASLDTNKGGSK